MRAYFFSFGVRATFVLDACCLFPQCVQASIPLLVYSKCWSHPDSVFSLSLSLPYHSSFPFVLPHSMDGFLPFLEVYNLLSAFSRCSVWIVLHVGGFFFKCVLVGEGEHYILFLCLLDPPSQIPFITFSSLIAMTRASSIVLNKSGWSDILVMFFILEEMLSDFHHWIWWYLWPDHTCPLLCLGRFPLCPHSRECLLCMDVEFYQKLFLHLLRLIYEFYSSFC